MPASEPSAWRRPVPTQGVHPGRCVRVRGARVSWRRVRGAGGSVTRLERGARRAEQAEWAGRGGAESSAEQPLPASADPGPLPGPALWTGARCCSSSRSRCVGWGPAPPPDDPPAAALGWGRDRASRQPRRTPATQAPSPRAPWPLCLSFQGKQSGERVVSSSDSGPPSQDGEGGNKVGGALGTRAPCPGRTWEQARSQEPACCS